MPLHTEGIDFIVPIAEIREKYPGGWEGCLKDHLSKIGVTVWFDDELFRDSIIGSVNHILDRWQRMGFTGASVREDTGEQYWDDMCVFERIRGGATLPCDWLGHHSQICGAVFYRDVDEDQLAEKEGAEVVYPYSPSVLKVRDELRNLRKYRTILGYAAVGIGSAVVVYCWIMFHPDPNYYLMAAAVAMFSLLVLHH